MSLSVISEAKNLAKLGTQAGNPYTVNELELQFPPYWRAERTDEGMAPPKVNSLREESSELR